MQFHGDDMYYFRRQALISAATILGAAYISRWDYHALIPVSGLAIFRGIGFDGNGKMDAFRRGGFWRKKVVEVRNPVSAFGDCQDRSDYLSSCSDHQDGETDQNLEGCFCAIGSWRASGIGSF